MKKGTYVKLTKTGLLNNTTSAIGIGGVMIGKMESDLEIGKGVFLENSGNTSPVAKTVVTEVGDLILQTKTSIYLMQKI